MRKILVTAAAVGITLVGFATPAQAAQTDLPLPTDQNCVGQTTAFLAQGGAGTSLGIGNVGKDTGLTVKEIKALVNAYCDLA